MSMYNTLFGVNPASPILLHVLDLTMGEVGRFRDIWVEKCGDDSYRIALYTRNGGGNRECWEDEGVDCTCTGCRMADLSNHPLYLFDQDDDFDSTYATIYFDIPEEVKPELSLIAQKPKDPSDAWMNLIGKIESGEKEIPESLQKVMQKISDSFEMDATSEEE